MRYQSQTQTSEMIEQLIGKACFEVKLKRMNKVMHKKQSTGYLQYIQNVSELMHIHRHPAKEDHLLKTITEPDEATSTRKRFQFAWYEGQKINSQDTEKHLKPPKRYSICLSHRERKSEDRSKTRKYISRRKIQQQKENLVPLYTNPFESTDCDKRIDQMRTKKLKLEEALRKFTEEELEIQKDSKKKKETLFVNYTTDFRGKVLPFCPKSSRPKDATAYAIKVQTILQSSRPWGKINFTSSTRKGMKEAAVDPPLKQHKTDKASEQ